MSVNKDLEIIKELLDDGCFDCCTNQYPVSRDSVKEVWAIAERMAEEIERLENEMNTLMNKNLPEEMREMHRRQKEYIQHQRQHLKNMTRKYKNSLESKQKALWGMSKAIDSRDFDISRLKSELEKRQKVVFCKDCEKWHTENCPRRYWDDNYIEYFYPESNGYCEYGRRESEEGK